MWRCGDVKMWRFGDVEMWRCGDLEIVFSGKFAEHCRKIDIKSPQLHTTTPSSDDGDADITGNIFPEGIQLGSTMILEDIFRIPEGMRPSIKTNFGKIL